MSGVKRSVWEDNDASPLQKSLHWTHLYQEQTSCPCSFKLVPRSPETGMKKMSARKEGHGGREGGERMKGEVGEKHLSCVAELNLKTNLSWG